jgi:hypothetical protein
MTMRSYDDIEFRPWYLPDTARWLKLSLGARGLVAELLRKLDRHGRIALGEDPAADLAVILRLDEDETRAALTELLAAGRLVWDPVERLLSDPDLPARMRMGSAARMAKKRALDAEKAAKATAANDTPSAPASPPSQPVTPVTPGHISSPSDLPLISSGSDLDLRRDPEPTGNRARDTLERPTFEAGTAGALEAKAAFESGVSAATGKPFALGRAPYLVPDLCDALNAHAPPELATKADVLRWLTALATTWCRATSPTTITPRRLLDWLNAGRPSSGAQPARGPGGGPRGDRQGLGGWTPPASTGTDDPFGCDS